MPHPVLGTSARQPVFPLPLLAGCMVALKGAEPMPPVFATDAEMLYAPSRTVFAPGARLMLDEPYRLAHLPLIAPDHPDAIAAGGDYRMGVHGVGHSLVLPIDAEALDVSPAYAALEAGLRAAPFAPKIAWDLLPRRASRLHATVLGGLAGPDLPAEAAAALAAMKPFRFRLQGLFSGNRNLGRLYLPLYPEMRGGENALAPVQRAFGRAANAMFLVGQFNLTDHLDVGETAALAAIIAAAQETVMFEGEARELRVMASRDDLVLDAAYAGSVRLGM
jgi:hypothetical protein